MLIRRLRLDDGVPVSYAENYLHPEHAAQVSDEALARDPVTKILRDELSLPLSRIDNEVSARLAPADVAELLRIDGLTPVLVSENVTYAGRLPRWTWPGSTTVATASHSRSPWTFLDLADFHRARPADCVFSRGPDSPRVGAGLGGYIVDLHRTFGDQIFAGPSLNAFMSRGPRAWQRTRERLLASVRGGQISELVPIADATLHLPFEVADFADFYSSLEHATNAARVLRPGDPQLHRNWREMPVGYHGRAGTVVVSGTPVPRPCGQLAPGHARPELAPTRRLDFEAEVGFVVGAGSPPASPSRPGRSPSTCSAWCCSSTGARGTSRRSSPGRWGRSWASPSRPRSRRGSSR